MEAHIFNKYTNTVQSLNKIGRILFELQTTQRRYPLHEGEENKEDTGPTVTTGDAGKEKSHEQQL